MNSVQHLGERLSNLTLVTAQVESEAANDVWNGWGSVILVMGILVLVAAIIIVVLWQGMKMAQAKSANAAVIAQEQAYRRLAEEATSVQNRTAAELSQLTEGMADLRVRVATIERVLREVE